MTLSKQPILYKYNLTNEDKIMKTSYQHITKAAIKIPYIRQAYKFYKRYYPETLEGHRELMKKVDEIADNCARIKLMQLGF